MRGFFFLPIEQGAHLRRLALGAQDATIIALRLAGRHLADQIGTLQQQRAQLSVKRINLAANIGKI